MCASWMWPRLLVSRARPVSLRPSRRPWVLGVQDSGLNVRQQDWSFSFGLVPTSSYVQTPSLFAAFRSLLLKNQTRDFQKFFSDCGNETHQRRLARCHGKLSAGTTAEKPAGTPPPDAPAVAARLRLPPRSLILKTLPRTHVWLLLFETTTTTLLLIQEMKVRHFHVPERQTL